MIREKIPGAVIVPLTELPEGREKFKFQPIRMVHGWLSTTS